MPKTILYYRYLYNEIRIYMFRKYQKMKIKEITNQVIMRSDVKHYEQIYEAIKAVREPKTSWFKKHYNDSVS